MEKVNWDFGDYNTSKYPLDLNSIPWYPATFPAPIPKYLIGLLSEPGDIVFDPFGGKGTTAVEALKQRRKFIYNDLNPHAISIMRCLLNAMSQDNDEDKILRIVETDKKAFAMACVIGDTQVYEGKEEKTIISRLPANILDELATRNIKQESIYWFHSDTLIELIKLYDYINEFHDAEKGIRKLGFLSILKEVCSQRGHFSYVTDNCRPLEMRYYNAINAYLEMLERVQRACIDFIRQYSVINKTDDLQEIARELRMIQWI